MKKFLLRFPMRSRLVDNIKPQKIFPSSVGHGAFVYGCATGQHSFLMSFFSRTRCLRSLDLTRYWKESTAEENEVYFSPNELDEKVGYIAPFCTRECADRPCSGTLCVLSCELWSANECAEYDCGPNR